MRESLSPYLASIKYDFLCKSSCNTVSSRVSSVFGKDTRSYGKQFLLDGNEETCWHSDGSAPHWIQVTFKRAAQLNSISFMFQGGFAPKTIRINVQRDKQWLDLPCVFYPENSNRWQHFECPSNDQVVGETYRLIFEESTDFYGRIVVYGLQFEGVVVEGS